MFVPTKSLQESGDRFYNLREKLIILSTKYGYPSQDGRSDILNNLGWLIAPVLIRMSTLISLDKKIITQEKIREIFRLYSGDLQTPLQLDISYTRWSFIIFFQFQIETLLKILLLHMEEKNPPRNYSKVVERILNVLNIPEKEKKIDILNVLAYARNAFHSNGIHLNDDYEFIVDNLTFKFIYGKPIDENFSFDKIHYVADGIISIIEEMLDSQIIQCIPPLIPNQYIPKIESNDSN